MQSSADAGANRSAGPAQPPSRRDPAAQEPLVMCAATMKDPHPSPQPSPPPLRSARPAPVSRPPGTPSVRGGSALQFPDWVSVAGRAPQSPPASRADSRPPPLQSVSVTGPVVSRATASCTAVALSPVAAPTTERHTTTISMIKKDLSSQTHGFRPYCPDSGANIHPVHSGLPVLTVPGRAVGAQPVSLP